jgi:radical SAM superfamily enzyme YgiQ (UPF0313 family)
VRIAFISANREKLPDACIPLGLLYVMAATPARHDKKLIDLAFVTDAHAYLAAELIEFEPNLVAVGIRNIQNNDYSGTSTNIEELKKLLQSIREVTFAPIILGGAGFSVMPDQLMQVLGADYGIAGEGEVRFPQFLESLETGGPLPAGIWCRHNNGPVPMRELASFMELRALAPPDRTLLDRAYYKQYGIDSVQTSRGCSMKCTYCTYPLIEGSIRRFFDPTVVADEFARAGEQGADHVFVVDSVFNSPANHAKNVCRELIRRQNEIPWTCYANPIAFDDELAELMIQARCTGMEVGSDSGCNTVLNRLRKGFTVGQIRQLHERAARFGIADCHTFILGTREETMEETQRTLDFIVEMDPFAAIIMVWIDDLEALDTAYALKRSSARSSVLQLLEERRREFPHWIIPSLGVNFEETAFRNMRKAGLKGPLWQHMRGQRARREKRM